MTPTIFMETHNTIGGQFNRRIYNENSSSVSSMSSASSFASTASSAERAACMPSAKVKKFNGEFAFKN